jgi:ABC-type Na+ transport system ATPase subunit NatA
VSAVSFAAARGEIVALMVRQAPGKSTILRAMAGLDPLSPEPSRCRDRWRWCFSFITCSRI